MPAYLRKLKKGYRWYYKFTYLGKTYHSRAIYKNKQTAVQAERIKHNELEDKIHNSARGEDITLLVLINERLDYLETAKTRKYYLENKRCLNVLYKHLGNIKASIIKRGDIQKLLILESKRQLKHQHDNYAVNQKLRVFKALFNYGINILDIPMTNPCQKIPFYPIKEKLKYIPSESDIDTVLNKCNQEQRELIEFVRDTGCRISEAMKLRRSDVFDGYVVLYTRKSKSSNLKPREAKYCFDKLALPKKDNQRVFSMWADRPKFLSKKTKGKWDWHNLRHRYASLLSKNGVPIFEIMNRLGHTNMETTQRYLQLLENNS